MSTPRRIEFDEVLAETYMIIECVAVEFVYGFQFFWYVNDVILSIN